MIPIIARQTLRYSEVKKNKTYRKVKGHLRIRLVNVGKETGLLVGLELVGQRGCRYGRHHCGQEANGQCYEAHSE